jgi:hypothetical protein
VPQIGQSQFQFPAISFDKSGDSLTQISGAQKNCQRELFFGRSPLGKPGEVWAADGKSAMSDIGTAGELRQSAAIQPVMHFDVAVAEGQHTPLAVQARGKMNPSRQ